MTAVPKDPRISELRELFRYLQEFRSTYVETGVDELMTPMGETWSLWDLEYLFEQTDRLTIRQQQAISLCLVHNIRERDAAVMMGVSVTNPVMMYATLGLRRLLDMIDNGELDRFRREPIGADRMAERREVALTKLADRIKSGVTIAKNDCWVYSDLEKSGIPRIRVRSIQSFSGFIDVHPLTVMYEAYIGPIPQFHEIQHKPIVAKSALACVNPEHAVLSLTEERRRQNAMLLDRYMKSRK